MSVIAVLGREHRLMESLAARLRPAAGLDGEETRARITSALRVLLPALQRHDELEDLVYGRPEAAWNRDEELAHRLVDAQHDALRGLRAELEAVLSERETYLPRLTMMARLLSDKLSWHLKTEEMLLWPLYSKGAGRSIDHSLQRQAESNLRDLENAVDRMTASAG